MAHQVLGSLRMANINFDPFLYTRTPNFTLLGGITLAESLYSVCPKDMPSAVKKSAHKMERQRLAAQAAWSDRQRALGPNGEDVAKNIDMFCVACRMLSGSNETLTPRV